MRSFLMATMRWIAMVGLLPMATVGCKSAGVIFPPVNPPVVWPGGGQPARIRYVGQLKGSEDLKPEVAFFESVGQAVFGKRDARTFLHPFAVCTDGQDRLFVVDSEAQMVHVLDLKTRQFAQWPREENRDTPENREKKRTIVQLSQPVGVAWDPEGKLYVADSVAGSIAVFDGAGQFLGENGAGVLQRPCGLAYDRRSRRLYVADSGLHQVVVMSPEGQVLARIGERGTKLGQFNYPTNVAVDSQGRIYVSDSLNFRVQQFSPDFTPLRQIGRQGDVPGTFSTPKGIAVDSQDHLYVVDANFEAIQIFDANGVLLLDFGGEGHGPGEFWLPSGLFIDSKDRLWATDGYNKRVQVFDYLPEKKP